MTVLDGSASYKYGHDGDDRGLEFESKEVVNCKYSAQTGSPRVQTIVILKVISKFENKERHSHNATLPRVKSVM